MGSTAIVNVKGRAAVNRPLSNRQLRAYAAGRLVRRPRPCGHGLHGGHFIPDTDESGKLADLGTCSRCGDECTSRDIRRAS
jgi:hypothetical protein